MSSDKEEKLHQSSDESDVADSSSSDSSSADSSSNDTASDSSDSSSNDSSSNDSDKKSKSNKSSKHKEKKVSKKEKKSSNHKHSKKEEKSKSSKSSKSKPKDKEKSSKRGPKGAQWTNWKIPYQEDSILGRSFTLAVKKGGVSIKDLSKQISKWGGTPSFIIRGLRKGHSKGWSWKIDDSHERLRITDAKIADKK